MADQSALYEGLRVVEHGCDPATEFSGKLLAQFGADVIKIETLDGPSSRLEAPLRGDESLHFEYYNAAKRSLLVEAHDLLRILDKVLDRADVFLIGLHPDDLDQTGLDLPALCHRHDRLVVTAITPFGLDGPWARYRSSDLVALAAGGLLNNCGYDDLRIPPIRPAGNQAYHLTASHALMAVMLALLDRARSERGQLLDVSIHATVAVNTEMTSLYWLYQGELVRRQTCRAASPMPTAPAIMRCADGLFVYFLLILAEPKAWSTLVDWLTDDGFAADLGDPIFRDVAHRQSHFDHIYGIIEAFCLVHEAQWVYLEGQRRGLPIGIVNAPEDLLGDEHLQARSFFKPVKQSDGSEITFPGPVCSFSTWPFTSDRRAPSPGEHTEDIQRELGGTVWTGASAECVITDEMRAAAGRVISRLTSLEVTAGDIRRWASAVSYPDLPPEEFWNRSPVTAPEDFNPLSTLCAEPPGWPPRLLDYAASVEGALGIDHPRTSHVALNAAVHCRYLARIRPGDVITATETLAGYRISAGRRGPVLLTNTDTAWVNQSGKVVKEQRRTVARFIEQPSEPPPPRLHEPSSSFPPFTRPGTLEVWNRFGAANDELYDIHMDSEAARAFGASTAFGLGSQLVAYVHAAVREWLPGRFICRADCQLLDSWLLGLPIAVVGRPKGDGSEIDIHVVDSETRLLAHAVIEIGEEEK